MAKRGRPPFEINDEVLKNVEEFAARGLTRQQIARALGIAVSTLCKYKNENAEFMNAIKKGEAQGIGRVANALFMSATVERNVTAQIFYLKNRAPDEWKDRRHIDETHRFEKPEVAITGEMTPQEAAQQYADTLRRGKGGKVVSIKSAKR